MIVDVQETYMYQIEPHRPHLYIHDLSLHPWG